MRLSLRSRVSRASPVAVCPPAQARPELLECGLVAAVRDLDDKRPRHFLVATSSPFGRLPLLLPIGMFLHRPDRVPGAASASPDAVRSLAETLSRPEASGVGRSNFPPSLDERARSPGRSPGVYRSTAWIAAR